MSKIPRKLPKPYATIKDYRLPETIRSDLNIPSYLFEDELQNWVKIPDLLDSHFKKSIAISRNGQTLLTAISHFLREICKSKEVTSAIKKHCERLEAYVKDKPYKREFVALYTQKELEWREAVTKKKLNSETRITSNKIITKRVKEVGEEVVSENQKKKQRFDEVSDENRDEESFSESTESENNDVFDETESVYGMTVVKEKNVYKFQTPAKHIVSPNKPIIQAEDLSAVKQCFDVCISSSVSDASTETKSEYFSLMQDQSNLQSLRNLGSEVMDWITKIISFTEKDMFVKLGDVPDLPFLNFIKFATVDFLLNCMRPHPYGQNDERTVYCEVFIPLFKAFGNTTKAIDFVWCEKKANNSDYVWLVSNNYAKDKNNLKLLDGIGRLINKELNYLLIESSGFNSSSILSHTLNDTLKNMKSGSDNLKLFISNYSKASFRTMKKVKTAGQWQVVECRSASVPSAFSGFVQYTKVFELFAFLLADMEEQKEVFRQLEMESLGLIQVPEVETVGYLLK